MVEWGCGERMPSVVGVVVVVVLVVVVVVVRGCKLKKGGKRSPRGDKGGQHRKYESKGRKQEEELPHYITAHDNLTLYRAKIFQRKGR